MLFRSGECVCVGVCAVCQARIDGQYVQNESGFVFMSECVFECFCLCMDVILNVCLYLKR